MYMTAFFIKAMLKSECIHRMVKYIHRNDKMLSSHYISK